MSNDEPLDLYVDDASWSYFAWKKHEIDVHDLLGTQRLDDLLVSHGTHSQHCGMRSEGTRVLCYDSRKCSPSI